MSDLDRTGSTFDKQGVIAKRKRWAVIIGVILVLLAVVIGLAVGVSTKQHHKSKSTGESKPSVPAAPSTPPAAAPMKFSSVSSRPFVRESRMGGKLNSNVTRDFLNQLASRADSLPGLTFKLPEPLPISFKSLRMYIRDMPEAKELYEALLDFAGSLDISSISVTSLPTVVKQAKKMLSKDGSGIKAWNKLLAEGHDLAASKGAHPPLTLKHLQGLAKNASRVLPRSTVQIPTIKKYKAAVSNSSSKSSEPRLPTHAPPGVAGRRLAGAGTGATGRKLAAGETDFVDVCIPVVFHVLQYTAQDTTGLLTSVPGSGFTADASNLIDYLNYLFSNVELTQYFSTPDTPTKIQFRVGGVEDNPSTATYLGVTEEMWAACYDDAYSADMASIASAATATYPASQYINVIVCGDPGDGSGTLGYAYVPSGPVEGFSEEGNDQFPPYVFIRTDEFLMSMTNNADSYQRGATTLAHELGHHLGLRHPHPQVEDGAAVCSDGDGLDDTTLTQVVQTQDYAQDLQEMCETWRGTGSWPLGPGMYNGFTLGEMSSCPPGDIDPVFNIMEYTPTACYSHFTPEQVALLQGAVPLYRPQLYESASGACPA